MAPQSSQCELFEAAEENYRDDAPVESFVFRQWLIIHDFS